MNEIPIDNTQMNPMTSGLHPTTTLLELNNTDIINDFIHSMRGEEKNSETNKYEKVGEALINDKGMGYIKSFILAATSRDKILADLSIDDINMFTKDGVMSLIIMLATNWEEWEIDKGALDKIRWLIEYTYYSNMTRAKDANTLKQIAQMVEARDINTSINPSKDNESFWKKMSPF